MIGKVITWKGSVEALVYLVHRFHTGPYKYITTSKGHKPIWKAIENHFRFYDDQNRIVFKKNLRDILHNITKRHPENHIETVDSIDKIVVKVVKV